MFLDTDDHLAVEPDPDRLFSVLADEVAVDPAELSPRELGERSLRLRRAADQLTAAIAAVDCEFERTKSYALLDGSTSAGQWLASKQSIPVSAANAAYRFASRLRHLPAVFTALVTGRLTAWHATQLTAACANPARTRRMADDQTDMITNAETLTGKKFCDIIAYWTEIHFGDAIAARAQAADIGRHGTQSRSLNGQVEVDAGLHPVYGTAFETVWARIEHELFEADWAAAKKTHGDQTRREHLWRTKSQRMADALVVMSLRADAAVPGAQNRRPLVTALIDYPTLNGRVCQLENGVHLHPDQVIDLLKIADVERAVFTTPDRVRVSEKARVFTGAERRAIELRDRHCTADACETTADRCDVDHIQPHADGGPTRQDNGRLRCPTHHDGRRKAPIDRPLPWEHVENEWDQFADETPDPELLDADMTRWANTARTAGDEEDADDAADDEPPQPLADTG